jgi:hypothetical protein
VKRYCFVVGPDVTKPPGDLIGNPFQFMKDDGVGPITQTAMSAKGTVCFKKVTPATTTAVPVSTAKTPTTKLTTSTEAAATGIAHCQTGR